MQGATIAADSVVRGSALPVVHLDGRPRFECSAGDAPDPRALYCHLMQADAHTDAWNVAARAVNRTIAASARTEMPDWLNWDSETAPDWLAVAVHAEQWRIQGLSTWQSRIDALPVEQQGALLMQLSPALQIDGCWLQHASSALNSHERVAGLLLRSYLERGRQADDFVDTLHTRCIRLPPPSSDAYARHPGIDSEMFALPAFTLALAQFPTVLLPQLLGFNLYAALKGLGPVLASLVASDHRAEATARLVHLAIAAIEATEAPMSGLMQGLRTAHALHAAQEHRLSAIVSGAWLSPAARMARLLQRKAPIAAGYHGRIELGNQPLDVWFTTAGENPESMLDALASSRYIVRGQPERSPLITELTSPRGAMAGIFNADEAAVVTDWIRSLDAPATQLPPATARPASTKVAERDEAPALDCQFDDDADRRYAKLPLRELYWRLLHVETYPEVLSYARSFANLWLSRAGAALDKGEQPIPFLPYDHRAFDRWLESRHNAQVASYIADDATARPSREVLIASCVQLCPMVYIDGAWLQRIGQTSLRAGSVGQRLYAIYLDEVGSGDTRENHPNLYRELMAAMGVQLPAFGTPEFAHWPGFDDASFRVPVLWLCLSQFPRHFLPEILGLTLGIELAGVGSTYRSSRDALRYYGFPSTFVEVHNTIDNVASGHTALAFEAIKMHLDEGLEQGGPDEMQRRWKRVWAGWRALTPPAGVV